MLFNVALPPVVVGVVDVVRARQHQLKFVTMRAGGKLDQSALIGCQLIAFRASLRVDGPPSGRRVRSWRAD